MAAAGLRGSGDWHTGARAHELFTPAQNLERAVLVQIAANLAALRGREWTGLSAPLDNLEPGGFGENLYTDALGSGYLCVGDVFDAERAGAKTGLVLCVTGPRAACASVDTKFGRTHSAAGVRAHCTRTGLAGWFARVAKEGDVQEGDTLRLAARPHPGWTLSRVSALLRGRAAFGPAAEVALRDWCGTDEELAELASLDALAWVEWRSEATRLAEEMRQAADGAPPAARRPSSLLPPGAGAAGMAVALCGAAAWYRRRGMEGSRPPQPPAADAGERPIAPRL